ncbi:MAG TPA: glycosyltransferase family 1 protein, partial [Thermomicrobiales bacterium]|nr:glycosyltransferase family 1 protein [Thermomicrobiales bacterium]
EPRKNLIRLIQAYRSIATKIEHDLVLVGPSGWLTDAIEMEIATSGLANRIRRPGFADDASLVALYSGAASVLMPSLYEGFGLPVLEAMACGAVVVTSNVSSLPEVAGDAAILVDPLDVAAIADGILTSMADDAQRFSLNGRAQERAKTYSWSRTAALTADVYHKVAR